MSYVYFWEYKVYQATVPDFVLLYGPDGEWVELFRRAEGYVRTQLFADDDDETRFATRDEWESQEAWERFRREFAEEFERIEFSNR